MENGITSRKSSNSQETVILVAVDFMDCSRLALHKAKSLLGVNTGRIVALHVIDHDFITDSFYMWCYSRQAKKFLYLL